MDRKFIFPPKARLKNTVEFDNVFKNGSKIVKPCLVYLYYPNGNDESRLGIVISKKIGKVIFRNYIKRCIREVFRVHRGDIKGHYDIVIIGRKPATVANFHQLKEEILDAFGKIGI